MKRSLTIVQSLFLLPVVAAAVAVGCWLILYWGEARQSAMLARAQYANELQHQINLLRGELQVHELYRDQATLEQVLLQQGRLFTLVDNYSLAVLESSQSSQLQSIISQSNNLGVLLKMLFENPILQNSRANRANTEGYEVIMGRLIIALNNLNEDVLRFSSQVLVDTRTIEARSNNIVRIVLASFSGLLALFITRLAFRVKRRIHLLHVAMSSVEAGDLHKVVSVPGDDEVSELAGHFDRMRQDLEASQTTREGLIVKLEQQTHTLSEQTERMHHLAHHDALTGLPNRMMFMESLGVAISQAERHGHQLAVLFIDLDDFKGVNDTLGHDAGDEVLIAVSERLSNLLRKSDVVARLGGDEFVIILNPLTGSDEPKEVVKKIMQSLSQPLFIAGRSIRTGASIGTSLYPTHADNVPELLKNADRSMYRTKAERKHC